jgi:RNA polymerase sigma factor (TIGR02999 family)
MRRRTRRVTEHCLQREQAEGILILMSDVTRILTAIDAGDPLAAEQLWPVVYTELRRLAGAQMARERAGHTLDATALVNEAYLRLIGDGAAGFANRRHFFATAAQAMRRILVESARSKGRLKRGGGNRREHPDLDALAANGSAEDLLTLHDALDQFAVHDPVKAKLVELRFFAGLTLEQAAECLDISRTTADRSWRYARAWLYTAMAGDDSQEK